MEVFEQFTGNRLLNVDSLVEPDLQTDHRRSGFHVGQVLSNRHVKQSIMVSFLQQQTVKVMSQQKKDQHATIDCSFKKVMKMNASIL